MPAGKSCRNPPKLFLGRAANRKRQRYACCNVGGRPADRLHCTSTFADASALTSRLIKGHARASESTSQQHKANCTKPESPLEYASDQHRSTAPGCCCYAHQITHIHFCHQITHIHFCQRSLRSATPIATKRLLPSRYLRPQPLQNTQSTRISQFSKVICDALRPCDPFATHWLV